MESLIADRDVRTAGPPCVPLPRRGRGGQGERITARPAPARVAAPATCARTPATASAARNAPPPPPPPPPGRAAPPRAGRGAASASPVAALSPPRGRAAAAPDPGPPASPSRTRTPPPCGARR